MPTYLVVRCHQPHCKMFQTTQQKKANKWSCCVCGTKQSFIRVYFESTVASECRKAVQTFNMNRAGNEVNKGVVDGLGEVVGNSNSHENVIEDVFNGYGNDPIPLSAESISTNTTIQSNNSKKESKWGVWEDERKEEPEEEEDYTYQPAPIQKSTTTKSRKKSYSDRDKKPYERQSKTSNRPTYSQNYNEYDYDDYAPQPIHPQPPRKQQIAPIIPKSQQSFNATKVSYDPAPPKLNQPRQQKPLAPIINKSSKWAAYVDEDDGAEDDDGYF